MVCSEEENFMRTSKGSAMVGTGNRGVRKGMRYGGFRDGKYTISSSSAGT